MFEIKIKNFVNQIRKKYLLFLILVYVALTTIFYFFAQPDWVHHTELIVVLYVLLLMMLKHSEENKTTPIVMLLFYLTTLLFFNDNKLVRLSCKLIGYGIILLNTITVGVDIFETFLLNDIEFLNKMMEENFLTEEETEELEKIVKQENKNV